MSMDPDSLGLLECVLVSIGKYSIDPDSLRELQEWVLGIHWQIFQKYQCTIWRKIRLLLRKKNVAKGDFIFQLFHVLVNHSTFISVYYKIFDCRKTQWLGVLSLCTVVSIKPPYFCVCHWLPFWGEMTCSINNNSSVYIFHECYNYS